MTVIDPELSIVISGRYPMSFITNEFSIYGETSICDDDSLASFLESSDTFSSHISITMLDMCNNFGVSLAQLTQIVSNNDEVNNRIDDSGNDRPLDDESTDGDHR
ncbi:hypothetical protein HAX54_029011 [Datura stramonium]|uniref:Uncharacterized protein n=1 Tax=Datura stramonium TaxID=4076 RepID=A0ABS8V7C7_DATST|nr:hypothetical protein [Datura stramonium]